MAIQMMPVPIQLDTREALQIDKKSSPNMTGVRSTQGSLLTGPGTVLYTVLTLATTPIRNLNYAFLTGVYRPGLLILTANNAHYKDDAGPLNNLGEVYSWTIVNGRYPRYAVANSFGLLAWTAHNEVYDTAIESLRVRTMDGTLAITPIAQDYAGVHMLPFENRLILGFTVEAGVRHRARLRWCVNGDFQDWTGIGSGFLDVVNYLPGRVIRGMMGLSGKAYASLDREIVEIIPTGSPTPAFSIETRIAGTGMSPGQTWAATEYFGFYLGNDAVVYRWDGANLTDVSHPVSSLLMQLLRPGAPDVPEGAARPRQIAQAAINLDRQEYWLLPDDAQNVVLIYDYHHERWYTDVAPVDLFSVGSIGQGPLSRTSTVVLGDNSHLVQLSTPDVQTYNSFPWMRMVETPDYSAQEIRSGQIYPSLIYRNSAYCLRFRWTGSNPVEVAYSIDKGNAWTAQTVTVNADGVGVAWFIVDFNQIRFRIKVANGTFGLSDVLSYEWERGGVQL